MESVSQVKSQKLKVKSLLISDSHRLLQAAQRDGLEARYFDLGPEVARRRAIPGFLWRKPRLVHHLRKRLSRLRVEGFGTVVLQSLNERLLITPVASRLGYRVIWLEQQLWTPFLVKHVWLSKLKRLSRLVEVVVVNSRFAKRELVESGLDSKKIRVLYPGLPDRPGWRPDRARQSNHQNQSRDRQVVIGTVGRLHQEKGIDVFIRALALLSSRFQGIMVGDGPARGELEGLVSQHQLGDRLKLVGFQADPGHFYRQFDLFCQPSRRDNAPLSVIEAMGHGLPIIGSNVGGIPELVGQAGLMVEADNPKQLARAIERLSVDQKLYQTMSCQAFTQAKKFTQAKMVKSFLKIVHLASAG